MYPVYFFFILIAELQVLEFEFVRLSWGRTTDKYAINWQNFAQVELQLKFAFRIRLYLDMGNNLRSSFINHKVTM